MPLLFAHQSPVMGIWKIEESWQEMLELFANKTIYTEEVAQIQSDKRKQEWLAVRLLIAHLTGSEMPVRDKENGAPLLTGTPYNISISHTAGYAAVILCKNTHPGIDLEYRSTRAWKLRNRFMSAEEQLIFTDSNQTANEPLSSQSAYATLCWCAKETAFKALQEREIDFIHHLHITPFPLQNEGYFSLQETKTTKQKTFTIHYRITENYIITWTY